MSVKAKVAVLLAGCGVFDGSEIQETVLTLLALHRQGAEVQCFAPNIQQHHVVNHLTGQEAQGETRNVMVEAARITRGHIRDLAAFDAGAYDAVIIPGGFGMAKNLSSFAFDGADCRVLPSLEMAVKDMVAQNKPIGALCIAPAVVARILGRGEVTIGSDAGTAAAIEEMGGRHITAGHGAVVVDEALRLATTPCYMLDAHIGHIADGADAVVAAVLRMVRPATAVA